MCFKRKQNIRIILWNVRIIPSNGSKFSVAWKQNVNVLEANLAGYEAKLTNAENNIASYASKIFEYYETRASKQNSIVFEADLSSVGCKLE